MGEPTNINIEEIKRQAIEAVNQRGVNANCPRCGHNSWSVDIIGFIVNPLPATSFRIPPAYAPMISFTCTNCGSTQLHNLRALGIQI